MGGSSLAVESSTREGFDSMRNDLDEAATVKGEMGGSSVLFLPTRWSSVLIKGPSSLVTCQDSAEESITKGERKMANFAIYALACKILIPQGPK